MTEGPDGRRVGAWEGSEMPKLLAALSVCGLLACASTSKVVQDPKRENLKVSSVNGAPAPEGKIRIELLAANVHGADPEQGDVQRRRLPADEQLAPVA